MKFNSIEDFVQEWQYEGSSTQKILDELTDESLSQSVAQGHRTLGDLAWHVVTSLHEMLSRTGLKFEGAEHESPAPATAKEMADAYRTSSENMISAIKEQWNDDSLNEMVDMYGQQWPNGFTLGMVNTHQIHHRGQMTVLMRQAGLKVPGMYGPSKEEWGQ
ncbi:DinB family protein [Ferdinandcohnia quinoae]|uniref:DinB family protein n=1 Tax=Fredinandcohnia quinoae TaxID=2918902 RepID=A0AAW5EBE3_9BACI|nr:DinB family protein [Fredinandcohnia sp. SECRCQ15]MCH1626493.1 DinB family protein [Fredinandcohnia sp. SECRCQ15]